MMMHSIFVLTCILYPLALDVPFYDMKQKNYLYEKGITCGITSDDSENPSARNLAQSLRNFSISPRVINGVPVDDAVKEHPWIATIGVRTKEVFWNPKKHGPFKNIFVKQATGVIITPKSILTCGHCVCSFKKHTNDARTCKVNPNSNDYAENLNVKEVNEIYYAIGKKPFESEFNKNIKVYVYNYNPSNKVTFKFEYREYEKIGKNGDIAVVIDNGGLLLEKYGGIPICLPNQNMFLPYKDSESKNDYMGMDVKLIGRGKKREEVTDTGSSCFTNEGVKLNDQDDAIMYSRDIFLPCAPIKPFDPDEPSSTNFCYKLSPKNIVSFSSIHRKSELVFQNTPSNKKPVPKVKIKNSKFSDCEKMWEKANIAYKEYLVERHADAPKTIEKNADRIIIINENEKSVCYNAKKLGIYGICKTTEESRNQINPVSWGFCSRACSLSELEAKEQFNTNYEVMEATYIENAPQESYFMQQILKQPPNVAKEMNEVYRCLVPQLPVAESAIFQELIGGNYAFQDWLRDDKRPERESGYIDGGHGDSGSPIVREIYDENLNKKRHITIGVYFGAVVTPSFFSDGRSTDYSTDIKEKCRSTISKLNEDVVKWLGLVIDYEQNCEANPQACENDIPINGNYHGANV